MVWTYHCRRSAGSDLMSLSHHIGCLTSMEIHTQQRQAYLRFWLNLQTKLHKTWICVQAMLSTLEVYAFEYTGTLCYCKFPANGLFLDVSPEPLLTPAEVCTTYWWVVVHKYSTQAIRCAEAITFVDSHTTLPCDLINSHRLNRVKRSLILWWETTSMHHKFW